MRLLKNMVHSFMNTKYSELTTYPFYIVALVWVFTYILLDIQLSETDILNFYDTYSPTLLGASASIIGVSLAAFSILLSVLSREILTAMAKENILETFLFPFYIYGILWTSVFLFSLCTFFSSYSSILNLIVTYKVIYFNIYISLIVLAVIYTIYVIQHVIITMTDTYEPPE